MWNMLNCPEQVQIQKYKTHAYKTLKTAGVQIVITMKHILISRISNQNGVSLLYIMLEIHHSGREPSICCDDAYWSERQVIQL